MKNLTSKLIRFSPFAFVIIAVGLNVHTLRLKTVLNQAQAQQESTKSITNVVADRPVTLGRPDAPVTAVMFEDYQCQYCKNFFTQVFSEFTQAYIATGKVKLYILDYPFLGQESINAAIASQCAQKQNKFWEYHDLLYSKQVNPNNGDFSLSNLVLYASTLNLDQQQFISCMNDSQTKNRVNESLSLAQQFDVEATPTFFFNDVKVEGSTKPTIFTKLDNVLSLIQTPSSSN